RPQHLPAAARRGAEDARHADQHLSRQGLMRAAGRSRCRLYLITPPRIELDAFSDALKAALDGGDVACLQLRLKHDTDDDILRAAERLMPTTKPYNVAFLVNDRPDLALQCDADGTHVGQEDMDYAKSRRLLGTGKIVGVTCHASRHLAMEAAEKGAD